MIAELPWRSTRSKAPWVPKSGNLSMQEILVLTSAYACPYVRMDSGRGGESQGNLVGGGECCLFLGENRSVVLGNSAWPSRDHRAFEKEVSLKAEAYLAKRLFDSKEVLNLRKNTESWMHPANSVSTLLEFAAFGSSPYANYHRPGAFQFFSVHNHGFCSGPNTFSQEKHSLVYLD